MSKEGGTTMSLPQQKQVLLSKKTKKKYREKIISKSQNFHSKRKQKLKQTKTKNPNIYWDIIKGGSKSKTSENISVDEFVTSLKI